MAEKDDKTTRGTAPSAANIEDLEKFEASEEAKEHEPSDVDAMGQDKRRAVVGQTRPTRKRQLMFFAMVGLVVLLLAGGAYAAVQAFDQPEESYPDEAPWAELAGADNPAPRSPSGPCGEPGNPPAFEAGTACANERTSDRGPALPGQVPPGTADTDPNDQKAGSGGTSGSSGSTGSAQ